MAAAVLEKSMAATAALRPGHGCHSVAESRLGKQLGWKKSLCSLRLTKSVQSGCSGREPWGLRLRAVEHKDTPDPAVQDNLKRAVAQKAIELVKPGMIVGLGTGSTSSMAIEELGRLISQGKLKDVVGVGTSYQSRVLARQFGVKTVDLNDVNRIDIAFCGADEVDPSMNLIKGGGGSHTLEKVVGTMAEKTVILVDQSKVVSELGLTFPVPVEVLPPAISPVLRSLVGLGGVPEIRSALRKDGPVITDLGNMIVDVRFPAGIKDPASLERAINMIPGVVENGLFIDIVKVVLVSTQDEGDISIVELADFVKSLKVAAAAAAAGPAAKEGSAA